jgi:hypothetical protein
MTHSLDSHLFSSLQTEVNNNPSHTDETSVLRDALFHQISKARTSSHSRKYHPLNNNQSARCHRMTTNRNDSQFSQRNLTKMHNARLKEGYSQIGQYILQLRRCIKSQNNGRRSFHKHMTDESLKLRFKFSSSKFKATVKTSQLLAQWVTSTASVR